MALNDKYKALIDAANTEGLSNLVINESDGVLHITGTAPNAAAKDRLWKIYESIDPNFLSGDVVMKVDVANAVEGAKLKVVTDSTNLNIRKGPGTDYDIIGKAAKSEIVTLVNKVDDQWWVIRKSNGLEGYCYAQYLTPLS